IAARIAAAFSSLMKSVNGSLLNSVGIVAPSFVCGSVFSVKLCEASVSLWLNPTLPTLTTEAQRLHREPQRLRLGRPFAGLLQLLDSAFYEFALERCHLVEKDYAVAVICLVQHAARGQFRAVQLELFAVDVVSAN